MRDTTDRGSESVFARQKSLDRAVVLPIVGFLLLMPPLAGIFQVDAWIGFMPFTAIYLFVVWAVLIVAAAVLSRSLARIEQEDSEPDTAEDARPPGD